MQKKNLLAILFTFVCLWLQACVSTGNEVPTTAVFPEPTIQTAAHANATAIGIHYAATIEAQRSPDVPPLPFADNPDPTLCGIPTQWNRDEPAWLTGYYGDELVEPIVRLYDSHLRLNIVAQAQHGTQVKVLLHQSNPQLDYYLVKIEGAEQPNEGWVPGPFLSFGPLQS